MLVFCNSSFFKCDDIYYLIDVYKCNVYLKKKKFLFCYMCVYLVKVFFNCEYVY